jgi:crossover junction endodeoxyribonuclease RuvC
VKILGVDCGTERTGYGVIESDGRKHLLIDAGVIRTKAADSLDKRLLTIGAGLRRVVAEHAPQMAAVEGLFHSVNAQSALKLAHARGVTLFVIAETGVPLAEYSPTEVKNAVTGYGRAEKSQVQYMVRSLVGDSSPAAGALAFEDAADAVAVAICHAAHTLRETASAGPVSPRARD